MKVLINERLSEHKYKTPEGYLICQDAILARTGKQTYRRNEVFNDSSEEEVEVDRKPEQVFSPQTLASFENKPVTVEHPDEDVNPNNYKEYSVGFVRDVHKGVADGQDVILGTLVITDAKTIEEIENGEHTELSCGYDCDIEDNDAPEQKNIRGNHVALCEQGRAGIARIVDSDVKDLNKDFGNEIHSKLNSNGIEANVIGSSSGIKGDNYVSVYVKNPNDFEKAKNILSDYNLRIKGNTIHIMKDSKSTYEHFIELINKSKSKSEVDDWVEEIEEDYHKDQLNDKEYKLLISKADRAKSKFKDSADVFNDLRRRIYGTKDNYYGFNLLLKSIERARQYGTLEDREAEILTDLWQETKKKYYAKDSVEDETPTYQFYRKEILKAKTKSEMDDLEFNIEEDYDKKTITFEEYMRLHRSINSLRTTLDSDEEIIEDAEENYNDLRKRILNTKNNKDEFEGILNRIERSKSAGTISDIEVNLLKRFWNEKKEQYYSKNPVAKAEGVIIKYVDGTDKKEKYIRVKSGSVSKAKGIYMALRAKNPKKYSYDYGIIPAAGSSQQEWKPFMETHPNAKFEEVYDMKTKDDFSTKSAQGYSVERLERANSGRYYAILKRANDYVVAAGYDLKDGTWGQGYYDYKTYEDALKGLKKAKTRAGDSVKDAMPMYEIRWIDLIEKSKGHPDYKYVAEIKANSLREALRKLHDRVVLAGTGSHNCLVMNVKGNGKTYMYTGRLDELLKQNPQDSKGIKTKELD